MQRPRLFQTARCVITLILLIAVSFAAGGIDTATATEPDPDLRLRPDDGPPGTTVVARGRDFPPGTTGTIVWADSATLGEYTTDADGEFEAPFVVPDATPGVYTVTARPDDGSPDASDEFEVEDDDRKRPPAPAPAATPPPIDGLTPTPCPTQGVRRLDVTNAVELTNALTVAQSGDLIVLADGVYLGNFVAAANGTAEQRITLCGSRSAIIDGGDWGRGYAFHLTGDYWTVHGITVTNALKGVMLDDADFTILDQLAVHTIGHEAVHFRTNTTDSLIQHSDIHTTGLERDKFGEGIYIGSAVSNWPTYTDGEPDRSDRNQVRFNRIWNTTSESIDIKEGTSGGLIEGNVFDGSALTGADSWVDVKGNDYLIRDNHGVNSPADGFQTHVVNNLPWGQGNTFDANTAEVNGDGYGFYIHNPETSANTIHCNNIVTGAAAGFANITCED